MNSFKGKSIHFDDKYLHVELDDNRIISTPMDWYPELQKATIEELKQYQFICHNTGIEWKTLDYHLNIESMMVAMTEKEKVAVPM